MKISRLENFMKNKIKIYVNDYLPEESKYISDNGYFCFLYKTEIYKYKLTEDSEISEKILTQILDDLKSRTKNKCLALLGRSNQTKRMLYDKLILAGYNKFFTESSIKEMEDYKYIDDELFTKDYFEANKKRKSIKVIKQILLQKGVSSDILENILDEDYNQNDIVKNLINKKLKGRDWNSLDYKEKSKIKAYIYSKGYKFPTDL